MRDRNFCDVRFQHTAARRRLAPSARFRACARPFQHTAARRRLAAFLAAAASTALVSTHSRPKAAGYIDSFCYFIYKFQHTAARRRLDAKNGMPFNPYKVSTHSRPKAAGLMCLMVVVSLIGFNTQPPEGGWPSRSPTLFTPARFQHTAARRRLVPLVAGTSLLPSFNTQPPEGGWFCR